MHTDKLAEKIAKLIAAESRGSDLSSLQKSIDALTARLDKLEKPALATQIPQSTHASQDRFAIAEAIVDSLFESKTEEKACTFETSKPCDHCAMCSSRGF